MSENVIKDKPARNVLFGAPLIKPKVKSEPDAENKPEEILENDSESGMNLPQKQDNALQIFNDTTVTTNIPTFVTVEKTPLLESGLNKSNLSLNSNSLSLTSHEKNVTIKLKKIKDPFTPKKPITPFMSWSLEEREKLKIERGNISVGEMGKELRKRWEALNPVIKQVYHHKYREEKDMYDQVKKSSNAIAEVHKIKEENTKKVGLQKRKHDVSEESKGKKAKKNVDSAAPKKPPPAFLEWSKVQKLEVELGNLSIVDMGKELWIRWASEAPQVKHIYQEIYKGKKAEYGKNLANYKIYRRSINASEKVNIDRSGNPGIGRSRQRK